MSTPQAQPYQKLSRGDLFSLEKYAETRAAFRDRVIAHKKPRQVQLGPHARLYFEDRLTVQYQVQEMLRIERVFEPQAIEEELETYNPLIPDGNNWKATFMLEYVDAAERKEALAELVGVEDKLWAKIGQYQPVYAIADEDLERATESKTASVHFVRFQLSPDMVVAARAGASVSLGIDHPKYRYSVELPEQTRAALVRDLAQ